MNADHDAELEALLALGASVRRTLRRAVTFGRWALLGRCVALAACCAVFLGLLTFGRPGLTTTGRAHVKFDQAWDATTGQPVSRDEWIARAAAEQ